jgi:hypothetical protein
MSVLQGLAAVLVTARASSGIAAATQNATRKPPFAAMKPAKGPATRMPISQNEVMAPTAAPAAAVDARRKVSVVAAG